eukprot:g9515.t1
MPPPLRTAPPYDTTENRRQQGGIGSSNCNSSSSGGGGSGRVQRYRAADRRSLSRPEAALFRPITTKTTAATTATRRGRSRSRDLRRSSDHRQRRRSRGVTLLGLVLLGVLSVFLLDAFRYRQQAGGEEARLTREVHVLEDTLRWKKALLGDGVAQVLPPEGWSAGRGNDGGGGGAGGDMRRGGGGGSPKRATRFELEAAGRGRVERDGRGRHEYPGTQPEPPPPEPPIPEAASPFAGDALHGPAGAPASSLIRVSLESQPGLIREPVPLIVGGTDGSGTRGVVALLQRLKVPMVVEDKGTMDVHGSPYMVKGGWPVVVRPVIEWARGAGYEPKDAPEQLRRKTFEALRNLRAQMQESSRRLRSPSKGEAKAKRVSWGFKAPISMLLVPFFEEAWGNAKFLHVVRDGRDIAFSGNQTPVEKFYGDMFQEGSRELGLKEPSLKAIALWDRWNVGVHEWAASRKEGKGSGMDYLLLHAEDLIDPAAKFAAIKDVAEFVGSPLSDSELCCIATEGSKDMGSHTTSRKDRGKVTSRFGKWKGKVDGKPQLSQLLHYEGERGLRLFGYEPERPLRASDGFQCPAERDPTCPKAPSSPLAAAVRPPSRDKRAPAKVEVPARVSVEDTVVCVGLKKEVDFHGFDVKSGHFEDHLGCCHECRRVNDCSFFTFDYNSGVCYLKSDKGSETPKLGLVSGMAQQGLMSMKVSGVVCFMAAAGAANAFVPPAATRLGAVTRGESSLNMAATKKAGKKEEWVSVLKTSDIAPGELVGVTQDGQELLIAADLKGSIYATANVCPHLGTPLDQGTINAAGALVCPLHKSAFSLEDGKLVGDWCPFPPVLGPLVLGRLEPAKDLAVFPVRASGGNIQVLINRNLKAEFESKYWTGLLDAQGKASGDYY